jgi:hypothetical protein
MIKNTFTTPHTHLHRIEQKTIYRKNGKIKEKYWKLNKYFHRVCGPAYVSYYKNGNIRNEAWYRYSRLYRIGGYSLIIYNAHGTIFNYINDIGQVKFPHVT